MAMLGQPEIFAIFAEVYVGFFHPLSRTAGRRQFDRRPVLQELKPVPIVTALLQ